MSNYEISHDQPNGFMFTSSNRDRKRAVVGRIREFETLDEESMAMEKTGLWNRQDVEPNAGVNPSGLDNEFYQAPKTEILQEPLEIIQEGEQ